MTGVEQVTELPWTVDADRIQELLSDMHDDCVVDSEGAENLCYACLCSYALYRLTRKVKLMTKQDRTTVLQQKGVWW